jgi:hypothetical protein
LYITRRKETLITPKGMTDDRVNKTNQEEAVKQVSYELAPFSDSPCNNG